MLRTTIRNANVTTVYIKRKTKRIILLSYRTKQTLISYKQTLISYITLIFNKLQLTTHLPPGLRILGSGIIIPNRDKRDIGRIYIKSSKGSVGSASPHVRQVNPFVARQLLRAQTFAPKHRRILSLFVCKKLILFVVFCNSCVKNV